jgi:acyl-CoA synthetase (NDP forming)
MWRGVRFSKVISYGNACDLNEIGFLEHLTYDRKTEIISIYIEGTDNPARMRKALEQAAREKIVVLLKGGTTGGGVRASASHTGALAGNETAWDSLCKQLGIIRVYSLEEMADMLVALLYLIPPKGKNACLIGTGGGSSVLITDQFESHGITVPPLNDDVRNRIRQFTPIAGNILTNPIDYGQTVWETAKLIQTLDIVMESENIDFIVLFLSADNNLPSEPAYQLVNHVLGQNRVPEKPIALVLKTSVIPEEIAAAFDLINKLSNLKLPIFYSYSRAAKAICSLIDYEELWPGKISKLKYLSRKTMQK